MKRLLVLMLIMSSAYAGAKVQMSGLFTDNMILQQQSQLCLHGTATPLSKIDIQLGWQKNVVTQADSNGQWSVMVNTPKASTRAYQIIVSDGTPYIINNVLVGELWFCSGQSNMEMPVAGWGHVKDYEKEIAEANYPCIRIFQVKQTTAFSPQTDVPQGYTQGWQEVSDTNIGEFSALAYFYARELWRKLGVPVGVINSSWGGTPIEAWMSHDALKGVMGFEERLGKIEKTGFSADGINAMYGQEMDEWRSLVTKTDRGMQQSWNATSTDDVTWATMELPGYWETKGLQSFDGVVWYRKHVTLTAAEAEKDLQINFGCIDDEDVTYWNGVEVARGSGYNVPRHYTVPARLLKEGDNVVTIRVNDTGGEGGIGGNADDMNINGNKSLAGQWSYAIGCDARQLPTAPTAPGSSWFPSTLYNAMVNPFVDFPIRGVIWYQGCANVGRAKQYEALMKSLVADWRNKFGKPDMPFHFVQLANYLQRKPLQPESEWAQLREAQRRATAIDGVEMMVNIDLGEAGDIHPKNKQEVARRLAAITLAKTYKKQKYGKAPAYDDFTVNGNRMTLHFSHDGITAPLKADNDVKGFALMGPDGQWHVAKAHTTGNYSVEVEEEGLAVPVAVSYGWADNPECTLQTAEGYHVSPFKD